MPAAVATDKRDARDGFTLRWPVGDSLSGRVGPPTLRPTEQHITGMDSIELDEPALIEQAKRDGEAFGKLYELYVDRIYNYVYYRTGNTHDAEDLTARIFYRAIRHIGNYEDRGAPFAAWLYRIARNMVANWYRDDKSQRLLPLESAAGRGEQLSPEAAIESMEDRDALLAAIRQLPPERQELLILKFVERMPNAEIGQIMGRTEGAIKLLYYRTLRSLREELVTEDH